MHILMLSQNINVLGQENTNCWDTNIWAVEAKYPSYQKRLMLWIIWEIICRDYAGSLRRRPLDRRRLKDDGKGPEWRRLDAGQRQMPSWLRRTGGPRRRQESMRASADWKGISHGAWILNGKWASNGCGIRPIEQGGWWRRRPEMPSEVCLCTGISQEYARTA